MWKQSFLLIKCAFRNTPPEIVSQCTQEPLECEVDDIFPEAHAWLTLLQREVVAEQDHEAGEESERAIGKVGEWLLTLGEG